MTFRAKLTSYHQTDKAAAVVPLAPSTPEEEKRYAEGEKLNSLRKKNRRIDLFKVSPSASEMAAIHDLYR